MRHASTAVLILAVSGNIALAAEPAVCDDPDVLEKVAFQYEMSESTRDASLVLVGITEILDLSIGPPPEGANLYATQTTFIEASRYCEGLAEIGPEEPDPIYWRIDAVMEDGVESSRVDHCSVRHDTFEDGCLDYRPAE